MSTYTANDYLLFEQLDSLVNIIVTNRLKLRTGTFSNICNDVGKHLQLLSQVQKFPTKEYDFARVFLEFALQDGRVIRAEIQNQECPEELWFFTYSSIVWPPEASI
jgi:hypothetical protein